MQSSEHLTTGYEFIDNRLGGLPSGAITALVGYPGTGKSQLLWTLATGLSVPVLYFGSTPALAPGWHQDRGPQFHLDDLPHDDLGVIVGLICRARRQLGIRAVFIDDLQRYVGHRYSSTRSKLRRSFLKLPGALDIALVASYSVIRDVCPHRRARWADLRGTVLEDPDLILLLHPESAIPPITTMYAIRQDGHSPIVSEQLHMRL